MGASLYHSVTDDCEGVEFDPHHEWLKAFREALNGDLIVAFVIVVLRGTPGEAKLLSVSNFAGEGNLLPQSP